VKTVGDAAIVPEALYVLIEAEDDEDEWEDSPEDTATWERLGTEFTDLMKLCAPIKPPQPRQEVTTVAPSTVRSKVKKKGLTGQGRTGARR
jgi:hypothetical protein